MTNVAAQICFNSIVFTGMRFFRFLADFRFFKFQINNFKSCWVSSKSYKSSWTRSVGVFRLFISCFRFFHEELSLMQFLMQCFPVEQLFI